MAAADGQHAVGVLAQRDMSSDDHCCMVDAA
jgi:hypothetical protein